MRPLEKTTLGSRSRIIGLTTAQGLHTLRAFRHRERNSYSLDLDKARVLSLGKHVFPVVESLKTDLRKLLDIPLLSDLHAKETGDDDSLQKLPFNQDGYFDRETRQILDKKQTADAFPSASEKPSMSVFQKLSERLSNSLDNLGVQLMNAGGMATQTITQHVRNIVESVKESFGQDLSPSVSV